MIHAIQRVRHENQLPSLTISDPVEMRRHQTVSYSVATTRQNIAWAWLVAEIPKSTHVRSRDLALSGVSFVLQGHDKRPH